MWKPLTGEPYAGKPHVRFGGRGGAEPSLPLSSLAFNNCSFSTIHYQLSTINYPLSTINYQLSTINYQLSIINYQLSIINYQLFIVHYSLFIINSPRLPAEYNSAIVRPRWRVVSTVKVRAGVIP